MGVALRADFLVSSIRKALAAAVFSLTFTSAFASPDEQSPVVRESAEVTLVEVPVNVIGRDGKPVAGLGPADFELEDDGVRQTITSVDVVDLARKRNSPSSPEDFPAAARRHFLLLFDLSFSTATEIVRAREAAIRFVRTGMAPPDLAAVASTAIGQGVRLHVTFTADRLQLVAAIRRLGLPHTEERGPDPLAFAVVAPGDPFLTTDAQGERVQTGGLSLIDPGSTRIYTVMARKSADSYSETRVEQHLSEMGSLASALNAVEGRQTIIFF
jgi:VWFA-related protein